MKAENEKGQSQIDEALAAQEAGWAAKEKAKAGERLNAAAAELQKGQEEADKKAKKDAKMDAAATAKAEAEVRQISEIMT